MKHSNNQISTTSTLSYIPAIMIALFFSSFGTSALAMDYSSIDANSVTNRVVIAQSADEKVATQQEGENSKKRHSTRTETKQNMNGNSEEC